MGSASEPVLLLDQDRSSWDRVLIRCGLAALARAEWLGGALGPYGLRAAIAACHPGDTGECPGRGARVSRLRAFGALRRGGRRHRRREQSHEIGRRLRIAFDAQRAVAHRLRERTALGFYGAIFGWEFAGPGPMPGDPPGSYYVARMHGDDVAGIAGAPASGAPERPGWNTHVAVDRADDAAGRARAAGGAVLVEPFDVAPAGRMAVIADPAGAGLVVWEAGERTGAGRVNEPSAWAMSLLATPDPDRARAFYGELFGWEAEEFGPAVWLFRQPGYVGGEPEQPVPRDVVAAMAAAEAGSAAWAVDFWIADADVAAAAALRLGGSVVAEPFHEPPFRRAILAAPDGATFSVSQLQLSG